MNDHVRALKSFNNRVERLKNFGIAELAKTGRLRTAAQAALGERGRRGTRNPSLEEIDAFVINLRFFIQDNEAASFRNLANGYRALPLSDGLKEEFNRCHARLNRWLNGKSSLGMNGVPLTRRVVFDTFIYGDVAHQNPPESASCSRSGVRVPSAFRFSRLSSWTLWENLSFFYTRPSP